MDLFIGARMHSTIAAFSSGVPVIPIAYSRKFNGLYDTLQYPYYIDAKSNITEENAITAILTFMSERDKMSFLIEKGKKKYTDGINQYMEYLQGIAFNIMKQ